MSFVARSKNDSVSPSGDARGRTLAGSVHSLGYLEAARQVASDYYVVCEGKGGKPPDRVGNWGKVAGLAVVWVVSLIVARSSEIPGLSVGLSVVEISSLVDLPIP